MSIHFEPSDPPRYRMLRIYWRKAGVLETQTATPFPLLSTQCPALPGSPSNYLAESARFELACLFPQATD